MFVLIVPAGGFVPGGSHSYNCPATPSEDVPKNNCPGPSPKVPAVLAETGTRASRGFVQFHAKALVGKSRIAAKSTNLPMIFTVMLPLHPVVQSCRTLRWSLEKQITRRLKTCLFNLHTFSRNSFTAELGHLSQSQTSNQ